MRSIADFTAALHLSARALQLYTSEHPKALEAIRDLERATADLLAGRSRISLIATKGSLLLDGEPVTGDFASVKRLSSELETRDIRGLVLMAGVTRAELGELARLLALRPQQVKAGDGAASLLSAAGVVHINISRTRYEAVAEGEEVIWSQYGKGEFQGSLQPTDALAGLLQQYLLTQSAGGGNGSSDAGGDEVSGTGTGGHAHGDGEDAEGSETSARVVEDALLAALLGPDEEETTAMSMVARAREILRKVLDGMEPVAQLALLVSLDRLPAGRARDAFQAAAVQLASSFGTSTGSTGDAVAALLRDLSVQNHQATLLQERLSALSVSREQLDEVLALVTWDRFSVEERAERLATGDLALNMPPEKLVAFVAELLAERRYAEVLRILERYVRGIDHQSVFVRHNMSETLAKLALFIKSPGLPRQIEQIVGTTILNHFIREREPQLNVAVAGAAANLIAMLAATGRCEPALRAVRQIHSAARATPVASPLRRSVAALDQALAEPARTQEIIGQIVSADAETLSRSVLPLVEYLGAIIAPHAIEALASEEDRNRRGRLVKALKTIGKPAFPSLLSALNANTWYVARNALNVLGDVGTPDQVAPIGRKLRHDDPRVRRAAARALSKIGGDEAESLLASALNDRDRETLIEVLICTGAMKAQSALPVILDLVRGRRLGMDDSVRELAITTLGQIGSEAAVPALADVLRARGILGRETAAVRNAAINALGKINTKTSRAVLQNTLASESDRSVKKAISEILDRPLVQADVRSGADVEIVRVEN